MKSIKEQGIEAFLNNENNFHREFRKQFREEECPMDETASVKIYYQPNKWTPDGYFRFEYDLLSASVATDYYPHDFERDRSRNVDELEFVSEDVLVLTVYGDEIPLA